MEKGLIYRLKKTVKLSDTAIVVGSGGLEVFSTPSLAAFMEKTAFLSVEDMLEKGYSTVGVSINIKHLKGNLVGDGLDSAATLVEVDGKKLTFEVVVTHNGTIVGTCTHDRFIINEENFLNKLKKR